MHKHARILLFMVMHQGIAMFNKLEFLKNHDWKCDLDLFVIDFCYSIDNFNLFYMNNDKLNTNSVQHLNSSVKLNVFIYISALEYNGTSLLCRINEDAAKSCLVCITS